MASLIALCVCISSHIISNAGLDNTFSAHICSHGPDPRPLTNVVIIGIILSVAEGFTYGKREYISCISTEREREREGGGRQTDRQTQTLTDRDRDRETERDRETDTDTDRQTDLSLIHI